MVISGSQKRHDKVIGTIGLLDIGNKQSALRKMFVDRTIGAKALVLGRRC
jgi:hypothetical protein